VKVEYMFHPGKVLRVFSPSDSDIASSDTGTQVMLNMWDENLTTVMVHKKLTGEIKVDDVVLVDYRPISSAFPVPKLEVTKVLKGNHAAETWKIYKDKQRSLKGKPLPFAPSPGTPVQPSHSYIG
jgi:hypothetical protein